MNYNQPPPQQQYQGGVAARPPPTNNNTTVPSTGKTPIARRTRSSKVDNKTTVGPPRYQMAPPPPTNTTNTTQLPSTIYNPKLSGYESLNVNDAIAKRRAELRHLQQRQRDNGTLTTVARNKLQQGGSGRGVNNNNYGGVTNNNNNTQQGVNNSILQQPPPTNNNKPPSTQIIQQSKPASNLMPPPPSQTNNNYNNQTNNMQAAVPTPPVARRLDNSYGDGVVKHQQHQQHRAPPQYQYPDQINPNNNNNYSASNNNIDIDNVPPMRISSVTVNSSSRPSLGNQKRNSEIFTAGKKKYQQVSHTTTQQQFSGSRENSSAMTMSGLTTEASSNNTNNIIHQQQQQAPKSPFGQARTILSVKQGNINPMFGVPPLMMNEEPPLTFNTDMPADNFEGVENDIEGVIQNNIMPPLPPQQPTTTMGVASIITSTNNNWVTNSNNTNTTLTSNKISPTASNSNVALKISDSLLVGEMMDKGTATLGVDSETSTPIMSNSFDEGDNDNDHDNPSSFTTTSASLNNNNNNNNMSRLMNDLQRTEREKAEAIEQVNKLRLLLATNHSTTANEQQPTSTVTNTKSSVGNNTMPSTSSSSELLNQFREMVTSQGASAAVDWMSKQLENGATPDSIPPQGAGLNYAGGDSDLLLSSNIPPLTPRSSRLGNNSRAASPERYGNVSGTTRGKRITTPLPKQLKASNDSLDGMINNSGDISLQQQGQQSENSNSPGIEQEYLTKASKCIPNEYGTMLASYLVRRPYLTSPSTTSTNNNTIEDEEYLQYKHLSTKSNYTSKATVFNPNTLEVVAYIEADNSILTLSGISNVRHGYNSGGSGSVGSNSGSEWSVFNNVEEKDVALGKVTYIDVDGNECDYWLDSIYEEALTTRESYCMSMISAAFALKEVTGGQQQDVVTSQQNVHQDYQQPLMMQPPASPARQQQQMMQAAPQQQPMYQSMQQQPSYAQPPAMGNIAPPLMNEGGNVAGQPSMAASYKQPPSSEPIQQVNPKQQEQQPATTTSPKKKLQPEEEYESADSALPYMIMSLFTLLLSIVTFVIKIPFRIGSTLFTFWIMIVVLRVLWLLLADDNGAWEMGAGVDYEYNMPGIY